ncbi:MAG TPA: hydroxylamine reductase, partial [Erysipelotrichaceae bacterium]|nr:hydroxylamine reductase [Erysipelotrichaceae bacterium]
MEQKMFCFQCQETAGCTGCTITGVCGKTPDVAAMQDLLVYASKGLSAVTTLLRKGGKEISPNTDRLITTNLFMTITNANFDKEQIIDQIRKTLEARDRLLLEVEDITALPQAALWTGTDSWEEKAARIGVLSTKDEDIRSLRELITYGL